MPTHGTFDVETSLAKGIIFRKICLANGAILKLWEAHPCPKFSREPPPPRGSGYHARSTWAMKLFVLVLISLFKLVLNTVSTIFAVLSFFFLIIRHNINRYMV